MNFPFHSVYSDTLLDITDSLSLAISKPSENFSTRFSDNDHNSFRSSISPPLLFRI